MAEKIYCKEADYLLTVKGNQGGLEKSIRKTFDHAKKTDFKSMVFDEAETVDGSHGRVEKLKYYMLP